MEEQVVKKEEQEKKRGPQLGIRSKIDKRKIDEETVSRLQKLKKYALHDSSIPSQKLNNYYCSVCGRIAVVTNVLIETLSRRKSDGSTAISLQNNFIKINLERDKIKYIQREQGVQTLHRWKCDCGMPVGYTAITFEQFEEARSNEAFVGTNKPYFYVYPDALVEKMKESKLISEIITYKERILLHLKRKNKK